MITRRRFGLAATGLVVTGIGLTTPTAQIILPEGSTVVLVRHADKAKGNGDVPLSMAGRARANALKETLRDAEISFIVTTKALRTQQTAKPLADLLLLTPKAVEKSEVEKIVRDQLPTAVLVVGHSDSIPDLIRTFGGPGVDIGGYDDLFVLIRMGGKTQFIRSRYGDPTP